MYQFIAFTYSILIHPLTHTLLYVPLEKIVHCTDTNFGTGFHDWYFFDTICPRNVTDTSQTEVPSEVCGGDSFKSGRQIVYTSKGVCQMKVWLTGAESSNLYSVYYLPIGADPCNEKVWIGEFLTNAAGRAKKRNVRACPSSSGTPAEDGDPQPFCLNAGVMSAYNSDPCALIPSLEAGTFLYYSRGPVKDSSGNWNTIDGTSTTGLRNPTPWDWDGLEYFDRTQFLSGI